MRLNKQRNNAYLNPGLISSLGYCLCQGFYISNSEKVIFLMNLCNSNKMIVKI